MSSPLDLDLAEMTLIEIEEAAASCTACELYERATQTVFGDGPESARLMFLGEQPGDREDREGDPFVGPAGRELDRALDAAGLDRADVYITNVVKHFRFELRGKKRLHKKPTRTHIGACRPWLDAELELIDPLGIVCLGSSAAEALLGTKIRVMEDHGVPVDWEGYFVVPTIHPSYILRSSASGRRSELFDILVSDIGEAISLASRG